MVPFLDRVIDINFYPTEAARRSNEGWRPIGLGMMGLQDVFFQLRLPFDSPAARRVSKAIAEEIYASAIEAQPDWLLDTGPIPATPRSVWLGDGSSPTSGEWSRPTPSGGRGCGLPTSACATPS